MTTLAEALAALDEHLNNGYDDTNYAEEGRFHATETRLTATVIQAARARVAEDEQVAKESEARELRDRAERDFRDYWGKR